ncbi:replication protein A, subunit RPA32 [Thermothelomyces heterothallicus CBS 203.75]
MTSYGGYQRTGYGAQGGEDGGGFMGASQQGSQGGGSGGKADDTLRPVTIKQLIDCKEAYPGAELAVDGVPTTQVTLVGQVRSVAPQAINVVYRLDDGTGVIDVKKWIDAEKPDSVQQFAPGTYVRVFGRLQSFNNKRQVSAHYIRAIEDFNEVNYHLLEATYVHLALTKGPAGAAGQQHQDDGGDSMFVDGGYGAAAGGGDGGSSVAMQARLGSCSRNAKTVFNYLANAPGTDGVHLNQVASGTGLSAKDIMAATEELLGQGLIYTTQDDETWAILDY